MIYTDKRSFAKGELSPEAAARTDLAAHEAGARRIENFIVAVTGGVTRSPGTRFVAPAKYGDKDTILVPFVFSSLDAYVIELGDLYARFYRDHGQILQNGAPYEIVTPWSDTELRDLTWVQEADVIYLFHPDHAPRILSRSSDTSWSVSLFAPPDGPFLDENLVETTIITASAVIGSDITLSALDFVWLPDNVGGLMRLAETEPNGVQPWEAGKSFSLTPTPEQARFDGRIYRVSAKNGDAGTVPPVHDFGRSWDGRSGTGIEWEYLHSGFGIVRITEYISATQVKAEVLARLPDSVVTAGTWRWSEGAWSDRRGYPRAATFADQRLVVAGSQSRPMTFWGSVAAGNYERFEAGSEADKAFRYTLAARQLNAVRWLMNAPVLLLGARDVVWMATGRDFEAPITPDGIRARPASEDGAAPVQPLAVGNAVLFLAPDQRTLLELTVDGAAGGYTARELTLLADHIGQGDPLAQSGFTRIAWQREPWRTVWCLRADGVLCGLTYRRDQDVWAWHRHPRPGAVRDITVIPHPDGLSDEVWQVVERTVNGSVRRYVEYMERPHEPTDDTDTKEFVYLASALTYRGPPVTIVSGLDHLEGQTVAILADGIAHPDRTVSAGAISLEWAAGIVHVGLGYTSLIETLPIEMRTGQGTSQARRRQVSEARVLLRRSIGGKTGRSAQTLEWLLDRDGADAFDRSPKLADGYRTVTLAGPWDDAGRLLIVQDQPYPMTILALVPVSTAPGR